MRHGLANLHGPGNQTSSVEERTAERLEVGLGDSLTLDLQGVELEARVTSIRRVRWTSLRPNFFLLLPPGVLEAAPKTFFAVVRVPDPRERVELTRRLVDLHANLTVIDLETGAATVRGIPVARASRRFRQLQADYAAGTLAVGRVRQSVASWLGHVAHGDTWGLRTHILDRVAFVRASSRATTQPRPSPHHA